MLKVDHERNTVELPTANNKRPILFAVCKGRSCQVGRVIVLSPEDANQLSVALMAFAEAFLNDQREPDGKGEDSR